MTVRVSQERAITVVNGSGEVEANQLRAISVVSSTGEAEINQLRALAIVRVYPRTREIEIRNAIEIYVTNPW